MIRDGERDLVADQAGRVAAAVDVLVVVEDRVGDRAIAVEPADERRPVLRVAADHRPVLVGQDLRVQDAVGQRELADVVQQARRVDEILLGLVETELGGKLLRVAGDGGRVACGHPIAQREGLDERRQHSELQGGKVDRARLQLVGAILRAQQRDRQVLEDQKQQDRAEQDRKADVRVGDGENCGYCPCGYLTGHERDQHFAYLDAQRAFC